MLWLGVSNTRLITRADNSTHINSKIYTGASTRQQAYPAIVVIFMGNSQGTVNCGTWEKDLVKLLFYTQFMQGPSVFHVFNLLINLVFIAELLNLIDINYHCNRFVIGCMWCVWYSRFVSVELCLCHKYYL